MLKPRKCQVVDSLYELGLSISYDQVLEISSDLGNKICLHYMREKAICPPKLKHGLFMTTAVDNDFTTSEVTVTNLPEIYTNIFPITAIKHNPPIPRGPNKATCQLVPTATGKEHE